MQQTGYCPRGAFCAFAHVDRKSLFVCVLFSYIIEWYMYIDLAVSCKQLRVHVTNMS
jgi:hypothetical protein